MVRTVVIPSATRAEVASWLILESLNFHRILRNLPTRSWPMIELRWVYREGRFERWSIQQLVLIGTPGIIVDTIQWQWWRFCPKSDIGRSRIEAHQPLRLRVRQEAGSISSELRMLCSHLLISYDERKFLRTLTWFNFDGAILWVQREIVQVHWAR